MTVVRHDNSAHMSATLRLLRNLRDLISKKKAIVLDGKNLDIASIVAVARHGVEPTISPDERLTKHLEASVNTLADLISRKCVIYGVNTGFGGSADTRTNDLIDLQTHLLQFIQSGIITSVDKDPLRNSGRESSHIMPLSWVRAAIIARVNQNLRGHSAIRPCVLRSLIDLLHNDTIPLIPLRGTISASGDLMPMAYIAGAIMGNPDVFVQVGSGAEARVMPSSEALKTSGLSASGLGPKEGLGLINGTAPSVAVASLALYDTQQLALLSQILTAFTSECLSGNVEWALPFIHATRPHTGQIEVASNIRRFLKGSKFVVGLDEQEKIKDGLCQDRYSTRTAPQWIGPYLEDLLQAQRQLEVELNSTSDNPLVDTSRQGDGSSGKVYSGGNFQATVVTSAMEKSLLAIQMIGRMLWSQVTEMVNPATNNGLEANLNASAEVNFTMKGIDINMSAYMSELAALTHPVSAHVMSAEMHNQGINSLALLSARRTMEAVDLLVHMSACHIYVSCQAIEIRANHVRFISDLQVNMQELITTGTFDRLGLNGIEIETLYASLISTIQSSWSRTNSNTWQERVLSGIEAGMSLVNDFVADHNPDCSVSMIRAFKNQFQSIVCSTAEVVFHTDRTILPEKLIPQLGLGTSQLYIWVRSKLNIPVNRGLQDDPLYNAQRGLPTVDKASIGSSSTIIPRKEPGLDASGT
ncbi:unnamed protein product [Penicillium manginii]